MVKVIGVGLPRTGTRSLAKALSVLGYRTEHECGDCWSQGLDSQENITPADLTASLGNLGAVTESRYWRLLVEAYPKAKIILTMRDIEAWWRSISQHVDAIHSRRDTKDLQRIEKAQKTHAYHFGSPWLQEGLWKCRYDDHCDAVVHYCDFNSRDILVYDVKFSWESLCKFLDEPIPDEPFPWMNRLATPEPPEPESESGIVCLSKLGTLGTVALQQAKEGASCISRVLATKEQG